MEEVMPSDSRDNVASPNRRVRVFIADEDVSLREQVSTALRREGFLVVECGDGLELFRLLSERSSAPDAMRCVVVAQVRLPIVNALHILHAVRRFDRRLPFVLITHLKGFREVAEKAGATAVLTKPFGPDELARLVSDLSVDEEWATLMARG
jgi:DNA-binding NtrC family response regulator